MIPRTSPAWTDPKNVGTHQYSLATQASMAAGPHVPSQGYPDSGPNLDQVLCDFWWPVTPSAVPAVPPGEVPWSPDPMAQDQPWFVPFWSQCPSVFYSFILHLHSTLRSPGKSYRPGCQEGTPGTGWFPISQRVSLSPGLGRMGYLVWNSLSECFHVRHRTWSRFCASEVPCWPCLGWRPLSCSNLQCCSSWYTQPPTGSLAVVRPSPWNVSTFSSEVTVSTGYYSQRPRPYGGHDMVFSGLA